MRRFLLFFSAIFFFCTASAFFVLLLYGYRFDTTLLQFNRYGVVALEGNERDVAITMGGKTFTADIPYIHTSMPLGETELQISKPGFVPFKKAIAVTERTAAEVAVTLAPDILTASGIVLPGDMRYEDHLLYAIRDTSLLVYPSFADYGKNAPLSYALPATYTDEGTRIRMISADTYLLQNIVGDVYIIGPSLQTPLEQSEPKSYFISHDALIEVGLSSSDVRVLKNGQVYVFPKKLPTERGFLTDSDFLPIFIDPEGQYWELSFPSFGQPQMIPLSATYQHAKTILGPQRQYAISLSDTLLHLPSQSTLLPNVDRVSFTTDQEIYISTKSGRISLLQKESPEFLADMNSSVLSVAPAKGKALLLIQMDANALFYDTANSVFYPLPLPTPETTVAIEDGSLLMQTGSSLVLYSDIL